MRPTFIVGCGRSGTTLLASMLNRHSRVAVPPETQFFTEILPRLREGPERSSHEHMVSVVFSSRRIRWLGLGARDILAEFVKQEATPRALFTSLMNVYARARGKAHWAEKTPGHVAHVSTIRAWFPEAAVLCLVRDGRDVVRSFGDVPWAHDSTVRHAIKWRDTMEMVVRQSAELGPSYRVVRYEELVTSPESVMRELCDFLGLEFEPPQLEAAVGDGVVPEFERAWKAAASGVPHASRIGRWRASSSAYERALMAVVMGGMLERWEYPPTPDVLAVLKPAARLRLLPFHPVVRPALRRVKAGLRALGVRFPATLPEVEVSGFDVPDDSGDAPHAS